MGSGEFILGGCEWFVLGGGGCGGFILAGGRG